MKKTERKFFEAVHKKVREIWGRAIEGNEKILENLGFFTPQLSVLQAIYNMSLLEI